LLVLIAKHNLFVLKLRHQLALKNTEARPTPFVNALVALDDCVEAMKTLIRRKASAPEPPPQSENIQFPLTIWLVLTLIRGIFSKIGLIFQIF
jgi:hypothetical protein